MTYENNFEDRAFQLCILKIKLKLKKILKNNAGNKSILFLLNYLIFTIEKNTLKRFTLLEKRLCQK